MLVLESANTAATQGHEDSFETAADDVLNAERLHLVDGQRIGLGWLY